MILDDVIDRGKRSFCADLATVKMFSYIMANGNIFPEFEYARSGVREIEVVSGMARLASSAEELAKTLSDYYVKYGNSVGSNIAKRADWEEIANYFYHEEEERRRNEANKPTRKRSWGL